MNGFARTLVVALLSGPTLVAGRALFDSTFANKDAPLQFGPALLFWSAAVLVWNKVVR